MYTPRETVNQATELCAVLGVASSFRRILSLD